MRKSFVFSLLFLFVVPMMAGESELRFTGNPRIDFFSSHLSLGIGEPGSLRSLLDDTTLQMSMSFPSHKSTWLAGGLSLLVPGAGEFYSESYWKSGFFFAAEVAGWIVAYSYDKRGDRQTDMFQDYANAHWSVARYVDWMQYWYPNGSYTPIVNGSVDWNLLNDYEGWVGGRDLNSPPQPTAFTHQLPPRPGQQYYELIGKYPQYAGGWDDAWNGNTPVISNRDIVASKVSERFSLYSEMRGKANDYYNIASTAFSVVIANHVLSAIDAFFTASAFNRSLHAEARMNMRQTPFGPIAEPVACLRMEF